MKNFSKSISKDQSKDTGMVLTLVILLIGYFTGVNTYYLLSIILLAITVIVPVLLKPIAFLWLGFSKILGNITSKIILTIIFFLVVFPIGMIRKMMGKDSLQLKKFKKNVSSGFRERNHTFEPVDIEKPY